VKYRLFDFPKNPEQNHQKIRETQKVISLIDLFGSGFSGLGRFFKVSGKQRF